MATNTNTTKINVNAKNFEHLENPPKRMVKYLTMGSLVSDNVGGPADDCNKIKIEKASEQAQKQKAALPPVEDQKKKAEEAGVVMLGGSSSPGSSLDLFGASKKIKAKKDWVDALCKNGVDMDGGIIFDPNVDESASQYEI